MFHVTGKHPNKIPKPGYLPPSGLVPELPPRWCADEMLGRLARYLRFVGLDTAYVRGLTDLEVALQCREEGRFLLTRDHDLAGRVPESLCLESPIVEQQWKEVRTRFPDLPTEVRFVRCSLCNGVLAPYAPPAGARLPAGTPLDRVGAGLQLYRCGACGHLYWAGSHTADLRDRIRRWSEPGRP
ncbi:MAG TPA: Mut7-C RNAse domain-containing protein [Thermoplasmata archaeon]|nr:Mut7-C RNAse domain-containing protein [Thermoplasmata archaeon]